MRLTQSIAIVAAAFLAFAAAPASAYDWVVEARVQVIETTYMPGQVGFTIDVNAGACAAGAWLTFFARGTTEAERIASAQAMLAALMTAKASNQPVKLHGSNDGCVINFVHLI
jgi:hypothetical protein